MAATNTPKTTPTPAEDTFTWKLKDGATIVVGKPGILKLKLRDVVPKDLMEDAEIVRMASAFLSVRTVDGLPFQMRSANELDFFMNRFKSDDDLDLFMNKYQAFMNPELQAIIDAALEEAAKNSVTNPEALKELISKRALEFQLAQRDKVRD